MAALKYVGVSFSIMGKISAFEYTRAWFDFVYENPDKANHSHTAVYLWQVELCNRLGWPAKFSTPTRESMMSCGIKSYNTYIKCLRELVEWGFLVMHQESKNQHTANVIALSNFDKAQYKALDKALLKHDTKQGESTVQSTDSIIKPLNNETNELFGYATDVATTPPKKTKKKLTPEEIEELIAQKKNEFTEKLRPYLDTVGRETANKFFLYWTDADEKTGKLRWEKQETFSIPNRLGTWVKNQEKFNK